MLQVGALCGTVVQYNIRWASLNYRRIASADFHTLPPSNLLDEKAASAYY